LLLRRIAAVGPAEACAPSRHGQTARCLSRLNAARARPGRTPGHAVSMSCRSGKCPYDTGDRDDLRPDRAAWRSSRPDRGHRLVAVRGTANARNGRRTRQAGRGEALDDHRGFRKVANDLGGTAFVPRARFGRARRARRGTLRADPPSRSATSMASKSRATSASTPPPRRASWRGRRLPPGLSRPSGRACSGSAGQGA
jgi:hypothetical protein